ncbi:hypothetical protein G6F70_007128 [Rhizopus microsporus]|uniref:DUF1749-domain-containing protein n=1 Tax=Rhizopus microsporus TaxID=58291 RepID=A0A1X0S0G8_RHIZD|nr:hypothetical protein G6F71_003964 [Rhizopus microsporus]KAG1196832.1 hypothetical protein G6F70_007128 [Rhizopus microsporus]KAG1212256.1 hypothetical protein G6F69_003856 [Rhizopus microsporus]KAG1236134.1 hypothetical protein G6F67_002215 [Rhizopus microsporus]KAG1262039.1 hypothetical protein G6F68_006228 [Rhizopus microsporus]
MEFTGELFTYHLDDSSAIWKSLVAFESGPRDSGKTVVFIGGLGDGFNNVPFLFPLYQTLASIGWSLTQVQLSSTFNGYGTTNLRTDAKELDQLIGVLKQRGKKSIVLLGHSTGSQDCYTHNKYGERNQDVLGYILQAPVSDREHFSKNLPNFQQSLELATSMKKEGKGDELLPRATFWAPITADRFYSLSSKGGDDDVFSTDLTDEEILRLYDNVTRPICWVYSEKDEFYASSLNQNDVMKRFQKLCPAIKMTASIPNGSHAIIDPAAQIEFCKVVKDFIISLE